MKKRLIALLLVLCLSAGLLSTTVLASGLITPSSAIDLITLQDIVSFLEHLKGETTMLMVAHSRPLLERVADRIIDL